MQVVASRRINNYHARSPNEIKDPSGNGPNNDIRCVRRRRGPRWQNTAIIAFPCWRAIPRTSMDRQLLWRRGGGGREGRESKPGPGHPRVQSGARQYVRRSVNGEQKERKGGGKHAALSANNFRRPFRRSDFRAERTTRGPLIIYEYPEGPSAAGPAGHGDVEDGTRRTHAKTDAKRRPNTSGCRRRGMGQVRGTAASPWKPWQFITFR